MSSFELFATSKKKIDYSIPQTIIVYKAKFDNKSKKQIYDEIEFSYDYKPLLNKKEIDGIMVYFKKYGNTKTFLELINNFQVRFCFYFEASVYKVEDSLKNIDLTKNDNLSHFIKNEIKLLKEGDYSKHGYIMFKGINGDNLNNVHLISAIKHLFLDLSIDKDLNSIIIAKKDSTLKNRYSKQLDEIDRIILNIAYYRTLSFLENKISLKPKYNNMTQLLALAYYIKTKNGLKHIFSKEETKKIGKSYGVSPVAFYNTFSAIEKDNCIIDNIKNKEFILEYFGTPGNEKYLKYAIEVLKIEPEK